MENPQNFAGEYTFHEASWNIPYGMYFHRVVIEYQSVTSSLCKLFYSNLKLHHDRETVAVRMCANFQIASTTESEDREV